MACCGLSRGGVALVAGTRVGTAPASSSPHARVRLPALLTARSLTTVSTARDPPLIFSLIYSFVGDLDGLDLTLTDLCAVQRCARGRDNTGVDICIHPCGRGRDNSGMNTSIDIFIHPGTEHGNPRTEHGNSRTEDGIKRPTAPPQAVAGAVADTFRPLLDNLNQLCSFRTVFDIEDYHIGMPFVALVACVGLYQVWKIDPSTCLDMALAYAFYKLSVVAANLRKQGFSNDVITRIQLAIAVTMALKDAHKKIVPLDYIRFPVFVLYTVSVLWDLAGLKKYAKSALRDAFAF
ncbi:hypothetical protein ACQ4PT_058413 [Festuca glaucescens]